MFWPFIDVDGELTYCPLADFGSQSLREGKDIYGKAVVARPLTAHLPLHNAAHVNGKIAVVERGQCDFVTKVSHAQAAGAIAVLVANSSREHPDEAFVMDAGRRSEKEIAAIRIPAMMVSYNKAVALFEQLRECFLDRRELSMTIKFLGAQTSASVLEKIEVAAKQREQQAQQAAAQQEREQQQREAAELLRKRLGKSLQGDSVVDSLPPPSPIPSTHSESSTNSTSEPVAPLPARHESETPRLSLPVYLGDALASSLERLENQSLRPLPNMHHWCPMTTSLLIVDVQNYFALPQNEKWMDHIHGSPGSGGRGVDIYKRVQSVVVPHVQDVLLACRACDGVEIVYTVVESATRDGRERSRAHKHAGVHVPKGGFGAQVLASVTPGEDDIVIPRTGVNLFEATNADYVLRNLGISHLVLAGLSIMRSIPLCVQTALDRGYQITLLRDAIASGDSSEPLDELLHHCAKLGCQVVSTSAFVQELQGRSLLAHGRSPRRPAERARIDRRNCGFQWPAEPHGRRHALARQQLLIEPPLVCLGDADDRIGDFVWKFPSEGSNASVGDPLGQAAYPRKCKYCRKAWVSSYVSERRHWKQCRPDACAEATAERKSLGVARRVWCEVDSELTGVQWREDVGAEQDEVLSRVAFPEIADVAVLSEPSESFQITTVSGRRIVFQCRAGDATQPDASDSERKPRALDARQWSEYLQMFSLFARGQVPLEKLLPEPIQEVEEESESDPNDELLNEIKRLMVTNDADALEELLGDDELASGSTLTDCNGNSLVMLAIKLDANDRAMEALLRAGVDCNARNNDGESPLLLAAASSDVDLLKILLRAPSVKVNQRCAMGATAFHAAANAGEVEILRLLCDHGDVSTTVVDENGWSALHYAAACPSGESAMRFLCELTPELLDARCIQGNTALHVAAGCGCEANARVLLETAANPHVRNGDGHTAYHVALHNHRISCATLINDYMGTPREAYEQAPSKQDRVSAAETTQALSHAACYSNHDELDSVSVSSWIECLTDDQIPYYYNIVTGESTWHKPKPLAKLESLSPPPPPPPTKPPHQLLDCHDEQEPLGDGQRLPLCMIPLVSPLVSLDDPTAATKFDSRRRKDRERRRSQVQRQRSLGAGPSVPPPPLRSSRVHHYEVQ